MAMLVGLLFWLAPAHAGDVGTELYNEMREFAALFVRRGYAAGRTDSRRPATCSTATSVDSLGFPAAESDR
jgi:hypothetical protein